MVGLLALFVATVALGVAAVVVALELPRRGAVAFLVAVGLIAQASVIGVLGVAGLLVRDLGAGTLVVLSVAWLVIVAVVSWRLNSAALAVASRLRYGLGRLANGLRSIPVAIAFVLVLATLVWRAFLVTRLPIVDYDGWSYHLVFVDVWLQHDALTLVPQRIWTAGYPANSELLTTWLVAFTRNDSLAGLTSLLPIPLAMAAVTGLARSLGARRPWALLAGLVFAMTPAVVALAGTTYVDNLSVATVAATWFIGLRIVRGERDLPAAALLGIAAGLAVGTKGTNVLLVAPVSLVAAVVLARAGLAGRSGSVAIRRVGALLLAAFVPALLLGGVWYLKNIAVYGNPLYPFALGPLPGPTSFSDFVLHPPQLKGKGFLGQLLASWTWDWRITAYAYNVRPGGLGRAWPLLIVAGAAGALVLLRRRRVAALLLVAVPVAVTLVTMPMPWYARLTLFLPAVAAPFGAAALGGLERLPWPSAAVARGVAAGAAIFVIAVATVSLGFANVRPNIDTRPAIAHNPAGPRQYLAYLAAPASRRDDVNLRAQCAGFDAIPNGARVAPGGFNLLHGVVGPDLDRVLTDPLPSAGSPAALADAMHAVGATWIVTNTGGRLDALAAAGPTYFKGYGQICQSGSLWQLVSG